LKFAQVSGDDNQAATAPMSCNQYVVTSDWLTLPLELSTDLSGMGSSLGVEIEHFQPRSKSFDFMPVFNGAGGFGGAMQQLVQDD
jgi:hypothetical protein